MFKSKLEVDRHVDNCLKKINNETERNLRSFSFAKLYFNVGDYEQARRYVTSYLSVKPRSAEGYHLLGKCLERLRKNEAALEAYRSSLQIDSKQNNLVIKVCELLSSDNVEMDQSGARYFCDLAQSFDPNNPAVYRLKERLITNDSDDPNEVAQLLLKELENRPTDVNLRVRLLKHFLQHNMIKEAYKHASDIEEKNLTIFHGNLSWYETFVEVLVRFERDLSFTSQLTWEFWFLSVSVLNRLAALSLDEHVDNLKSTSEYVSAVFDFDQMLSKASQNISGCPDRQLASVFLNHYHAQLYFHLAVLVFKQAKKDLLSFKDASNMTLPIFLAAYHVSPPDLQSMWLIHSPEKKRRLVHHWHKEACYRCSQTGHVLLTAAKDRKSVILDRAMQYSTGIWRDQLFKKVFVKRDQHLKMTTSFFVSNSQPLEPVFKLPDPTEMLIYDKVAQLAHPDSLHHYIWIALNNKLADVEVSCFDGLPYSVRNLSNCSAESLSVLDVQTFLYCATLCAKTVSEDKHLIYFNPDKPKMLPASITENLGTLNQSKFFTAAYKMYKNEPEVNMGELRMLLIKGIEVVRCVGHHGLDVKLLVKLANVFEERSKHLSKQSEIEFTNARAELLWKTALPLLEKLKNNQVITYSASRLFEYRSKEMSIIEAAASIEKGKLFTAVQLMKMKEYERALHIFEQLKDPYASFNQSQIYKHLADQKSESRENFTSEMRSQNVILLSKARDCLYLTLDRLREPSVDRSHPLNSQLGTEIEKMERLLARIDPDGTNRNECDGMSDENPSSDNSVGEQYLSTYTHHPSFQNGTNFTPKHDPGNYHSTPLRYTVTRQEAKPSPERLDAQIRQLVASRDTALSGIVEQNKLMVESHKSLLDELRSFKDAVNNLTAMIDDLRTMKRGFDKIDDIGKAVEELKNSFDVQGLIDSIQEVKKEVHELKKDQNKNNQLSDEDLYVLDPDYGVDYSINSNMGAYGNNLPNIYPNYPAARLPNANALAAYGHPGIYPGLYPGLAYAYGGLGLPQPGTLPLVPDQQVASIMSSVPGAYPPPVMPPATLNQVMPPNAALGVNILTGQALSQPAVAAPRTAIPNVTNTTQSAFPTIASSVSSSINFSAASKAPPLNVVITSSDPLPTNKLTTSQPILSVTIPPQHIKNSTAVPKPQPHNYQIPLSASSLAAIATTPSILSKPPPAISTQSLLSNVAPPIFSAVSQSKSSSKNVSLGLQIEKTLNQTFSSDKNNSSLNNSNVSSTSLEEHDPCPDFRPIVPLPDEVPVNTGEESEIELFCERAKLFRHVNNNGVKEWKERGVGSLKILNNSETGKVRVLMRRDQVHKICANHFITIDMTVTPMVNSDRAYVWVAHDFADEVVVVETFCVRFKTAEEAKKFADSFEAAKKLLSKPKEKGAISKTNNLQVIGSPKTPQSQAVTLGGFVFTSTPTFKPKEQAPAPKITELQETPAGSPFGSFTFGKTSGQASSLFKTSVLMSEAPTFSPLVISQEKASTSQNENVDDSKAEDFVPTAEFKPVVSLPDLVEVVTGEENCEILFEAKAKLFRYNTTGATKEWKERGVGTIKILKDDSIRLLMRRDQVHKVCCNHTVLKDMTFKLNSSNAKAVVWAAKDFSEGVLTPETFTIRFKTEELANQFFQTLQSAQTSMDENNKVVSNKHHKPETRPRTTSFGDKFKPAKGSWECKNCYIVNEGKVSHCVACETAKSGTAVKKDDSGPVFSFGNFANKPEEVKPTFSFGQQTTSSWGKAFKPSEGSWECKACYTRNSGDKDKCVSCEGPKGDNTPTHAVKSVNLDTPGQKFTFGIPTTKSKEAKEATPGFGDAFKPKRGSWECKSCLIRNEPEKLYCASCETPKDDTVPQKEAAKGINLDTPGQKFTFGFPSTKSIVASAADTPTETETTFRPAASSTITFKPTIQLQPSPRDKKFVFGSPQKHDFEFKPRSPRRISQGQGDEESDGSYVEEEEDNIYFKPLIPLPEKVDVKTGEENEEVLYCHRAKLFRFVSGEWKERGLGDIKILRGKNNGKLRIVMRREQVFKICLNHMLSKDIEYLPKDEKSWLFHAADFSESKISRDQFCLRFKSSEIAQEFKKAVDSALEGSSVCGQGDAKVSSSKADSDDDIEIVSETKVTPEEEKEAIRLGLPPKYFAYRQLPDCACEQCKKDDEYLKELFATKEETGPSAASPSSKVTGLGTPSTTSSTGNSVFGTPVGGAFSFSSQSQGKSESLKEILLKPSILKSPLSPLGKTPERKENLDLKTTEEPAITNPFSFSFGTSDSSKSSNSFTPKSGNIFVPSTGGLFSATAPSPNAFSGSSSNLVDSKSSSETGIFGSATSSTTSLFSGTNAAPVFGTAVSSNTSIFSGNTNSSPSIFGGNTSNIFGSANKSATTPLFGPNAVTTTSGIFGAAGTPLFGSTTSSTTSITSSIFGMNTTNASTTPIFGASTISTNAQPAFGLTKPPIFGSSLTGNVTAPMFGSSSISLTKPSTTEASEKASEPTDSAESESGNSVSASKSESGFNLGNLAKNIGGTPTTVNLKEDDEVVLKTSLDLSFASLAANTSPDSKPAFSKTGDASFSFLGAGAPVFGSKDKKKKSGKAGGKADKSKDESDDEDEEAQDGQEHDPHFEPIVPLPDAIVVSTGEEDETALFNERAKLYRFDSNTKEWKERGVGQIKILHHPQNSTYRLLLRREQVFKIVLNQLIVPTLELQPMSTSDKAWMWAGYNYTENENTFEKLAVRFKYVELAKKFYEAVQSAIAKVTEIQNSKSVPASVQNYGVEDVSNDSQSALEEGNDEYEDVEDEEEDDDDEDYEDDRSVMFMKRCTLSEMLPEGAWKVISVGDLQVYYDPDLYAARIAVNDDTGQLLSNTLIAINTLMDINKNECTWKAVEWVEANTKWRTLKATFSSEMAAQEFHSNYLEGLNYAQQVGIVDELTHEPDIDSEEG